MKTASIGNKGIGKSKYSIWSYLWKLCKNPSAALFNIFYNVHILPQEAVSVGQETFQY